MKRIPDSLTPEQAWSRMCTAPILPAENKPLEDSVGHCLTADLNVPRDVPESNRSFMDGFGVRSEDVRQVPSRLKIVGEILMGSVSETKLNPGEAVFVPTGGFLPKGVDAVVMQEDTERSGEEVIVQKSVAANENVQLRGEDFKKKQLLFSAHHRLRAQDLGTLATFGITEVPVVRKPTIAIISTGNELVDFRLKPRPGQIPETNALTLASAARAFEFTVHRLGIIKDEPDAQKEAMSQAIRFADVVLFSGGSSVGERDYTMEVIQSFRGFSLVFHGLAIRPGNPTIFATNGEKSIFGLPGQPVSSLVVFYQFVLPFLFHLSGEKIEYTQFAKTRFANVPAKLDHTIQPLKIKTDYVRVRLRNDNGWIATPIPGKSASLSTLAHADGFAIIPPGEEPIASGSEITVYLFP